jgi:hypothetical protein
VGGGWPASPKAALERTMEGDSRSTGDITQLPQPEEENQCVHQKDGQFPEEYLGTETVLSQSSCRKMRKPRLKAGRDHPCEC